MSLKLGFFVPSENIAIAIFSPDNTFMKAYGGVVNFIVNLWWMNERIFKQLKITIMF